MKKVLITGAGSYIGEKTAAFIRKKEPEWIVDQLDVQTDEWKQYDFSGYEIVFHVAGLAHRKITPENEPLYYKVNRDLAIEVAEKAKNSKVGNFIFMSSMSVYSDRVTYVNQKTPTEPDNAYGKSKLQAEQGIIPLTDKGFKVSILRPPMIYGKGCKGNYNSLRSLALKMPVFPKVDNKRSMLFIDNLTEFIYQLILTPQSGFFYPQNKELVNTTEWVKYIAEEHGKKIHISCLLGKCARIGMYVPGIKHYCVKAFGDSFYDSKMSVYEDINYQIIDFRQSITMTEEE